MKLLETFDGLLENWRGVFWQERTFKRARRLTFGLITCLRVHLTSSAICASGRQFQDWSADYRLCSRAPWDPRRLFDVVLDHRVPFGGGLGGSLGGQRARIIVEVGGEIGRRHREEVLDRIVRQPQVGLRRACPR